MFNNRKTSLIKASDALPGRMEPLFSSPKAHFVNGNPLTPPFADDLEYALFGLGCFWGAERLFWQLEGVFATSVGYSAGYTPNPSYEEVCSGRTGHNEVVQVIFDPKQIGYSELLKFFWEGHNPTQGMQQGNDIGTQYRSGIYTYSKAQQVVAKESVVIYQRALSQKRGGEITTEVQPVGPFYFAEGYHQQYLAKNPGGYCGLGGTGTAFIWGDEAKEKEKGDLYRVPKISRLLSGKPLDEVIMDPANPNFIVDKG